MADTSGTTEPTVEELEAENARLKAELEHGGSRPPLRIRRFFTVVLVILTSISVVLATVGVWANRTVWNQDRYLALVTPIAQDPAITNALATKLTDEVFTALDLEQKVNDLLANIPNAPAQLALVSGPVVASLHNVVEQQVGAFLRSDAFQGLWVDLNTRLHTKIVALLNGDYSQLPNVSIDGGDVQLNLIPAVIDVIQQVLPSIGINVTLPTIPPNLDVSGAISLLSSKLGVSLPSDFGQLTIMSADKLHTYQAAAKNLKRIGYGLIALVLILAAITLVVSVERRKTLVWLGIGAAAAVLVGLPVIRAIENQIVNAITSPDARSAARDIVGQVAAGLRRIGGVVVVLALLVALVAYLVGRPRWFEDAKTQARDLSGDTPAVAFVARNADRVRIALVALAVLLLIWIGIGWISVVLIGGALALLMWGVAVAQHRAATGPPVDGSSGGAGGGVAPASS